jgi:ABC-type sugar transport system substrate-binding protein
MGRARLKVAAFTALAVAAMALVATNVGGAASGGSGKKPVIGFVVHVKGNPFIQQIIDGAMAAGQDLGVEVRVAGPAGFDANEQLKNVQDLFAAGASGVATSIPGESMVKPLNDLIAQGKPIVSFNLMSKNLNAPYVGERSTNSGRILGGLVASKLGGPSATGTAVVGICAPGLAALENRGRGVKQGVAKAAPKVKVVGPFDVKVAANENYAAWEQLLAKYGDAKAMIGLCAPDVASLGKLNKSTGGKVVGGGYDTTAENLAAIQNGNAFVTLGQTPFVQGYMPVKMIYDALTKKAKLRKGFLESGTEIVTAAGATEPWGLGNISFARLTKLANSKGATRTFYTPLVKKKLANWQKLLEPIANEGK